MSFSLDFLNEIKIEETPASLARVSKKSNSVTDNPAPTFMGIRIWKSGKIFPSQALTDAFCLEYPTKVVSTDVEGKVSMTTPDGVSANGLDVFSISDWTQVDEATRKNNLILIGVTPKSKSKVDLFANSRYNDDGTPVASVMSQGSSTFGSKRLLPMIESVYGVTPNAEGYIDLEINTKFNLKSKALNGIFMLPKVITKGDNIGKADIEQRENIDVFPMTPVVAQVETPVESTSMSEVPAPPVAIPVTDSLPVTGSDFDLDSQY